MRCAYLVVNSPFGLKSFIDERPRILQHRPSTSVTIRCSSSYPDVSVPTEKLDKDSSVTGGAYDFKGATTALTHELLSSPKKVTLVRHGLSSWNEESRVQGSSNLSILTDTGARQAEKCRRALENNLEAVDARKNYPEEYHMWREDPANFCVNGIYPIRKLWGTAQEAWMEILSAPGENFLVITHKSILRALVCTALGLGPERFRAIDVNNGGISVFNFNRRGEAMLQSLNMTAHMYSDYTYHY
ncbi:probable 2-carboxy-D-arabinitol-1-phosphatase isoform X2 [Macadamia integrifolia]|uniref:probable 2-carboxy-D-arabinitol-1-phosphatase isoform X2 n=1 Tax=Macadamia integrifolia TaxID=60698 RepID=UPI001C4E3C07|nr:probable 2-carboxy-D-arabinitol-1-phosphatase isoform X2 [Macadamia integrifolia]